ncbi:MAG: thioesterase family protein [Clostridiales bacterium]|nr:thioesterase family protein [Clostridiales bacterium]
MDYNLKNGMSFTSEIIVEKKDTAAAFGSGNMYVLSTPMMIGLMENASLNAVDKYLPKGYQTVGIHLDVKHLAATPMGMKASATAELIEIDEKKLRFKVVAYDEKDKIGEGYHSRFIIESKSFMEMTEMKKGSEK